MNDKQHSKRFLIPLLIIFGAINTLLLELQGYQIVGNNNDKFFHPFIQCSLMFFGQFLCVIIYLVNKKRKTKFDFLDQSNFMKQQAPLYMPIIPATFDLFSSVLAYIALSFTPGSVWQMSRGATIIITVILSKIILKNKFTKTAFLGCSLTFLGISLVQVFNIVIKEDKYQSLDQVDTNLQILGVCLLFISLVFNSLLLVTEKWIFNKYIIAPQKLIFLQGLYGFILSIGLAIIGCLIKCPWSSQAPEHCVKVQNQFYMESFSNFLSEIEKNTYLLILCISLILSMAISIPIAAYISKYIGIVSRVLADIARTVIIWGVGIILSRFVEKYKGFQSLDIVKNVLKGLGFMIMIFGVLIYHKIIKTFKQDDDRMTSSLLSQTQGQKEYFTGRKKQSTITSQSIQSFH